MSKVTTERQNVEQRNHKLFLRTLILEIASNSIDCLYPATRADSQITVSTDLKVSPAKYKVESKNKIIRANVFKCLKRMLRLDDELFTQYFITKGAINNNKDLNEKTIEKLIQEALQIKEEKVNVENELRAIKERAFERNYIF